MPTADRSLLPDPLVTSAGAPVDSPAVWRDARRGEILELFRTHVYGRAPAAQTEMPCEVFEEDLRALGGTAIRRQVAVRVAAGSKELRIDLLLHLPASAARQPVPVFVLLNFGGNHTTHPDPAIALPRSYLKPERLPAEDHRGDKADSYAVEAVLARGYGLATAYYGDIDPDFHDGFRNGAHGLLDSSGDRPVDAWGAVGAWAWGLSRILDYLATDNGVDATRVAVAGHSRLGKTALWAGAQDERFALVFSNDSGCTGAALARGKQGETIQNINESFPHWFCETYKRYNGREEELPVDQHMLLALITPRPLYVASATEDLWADPAAEFAACVATAPVYRLLGWPGLEDANQPPPDQPRTAGRMGYHMRTGKHALTAYDWARVLDFADAQLGAGPPQEPEAGR